MKGVFVGICIWVMVFVSIACGMCVNVLLTPKAVAGVEPLAMRVVLDAGHGGMDGGVVGRTSGVKESDLILAIVYQIKPKLEEMGFEVVLTRKTQAGLYESATKGFKRRDMEKRKEIIQQANPALVLSIHQNYYPSMKTRGAQVFYRKGNERGQRLATAVQKRVNDLYVGVGGRARTMATGDFFMLTCVDCPSILVECGFLSNGEDERLLQTESWQKQLAEGICAGVLEYFDEFSV